MQTPHWIALVALASLAACSASQTPSGGACTGAHVMRDTSGHCLPCGDDSQSCCPDDDPNTGPPFGDFCWQTGFDCLAADGASADAPRSCIRCGHVGERACASGCVEGFPEPRPPSNVQYCSCNVPAGMPPLPNCPGTS